MTAKILICENTFQISFAKILCYSPTFHNDPFYIKETNENWISTSKLELTLCAVSRKKEDSKNVQWHYMLNERLFILEISIWAKSRHSRVVKSGMGL